MRRCWPLVMAFALGISALAVLMPGCHEEREREVEVIHERPEHDVLIEREHEHEHEHERERGHEHEHEHEGHAHGHREGGRD